ncbi:MAG: PAS domain S-box protein [Janthinobacterium lividum]
MAADDPDDFDEASSYEALVEFLYLAPVGIIKFRPDGTIDMANPTAAQLLMPLAEDGDMSNLYQLMTVVAPDLREHVERYAPSNGQIFDQMQLLVPITQNTLMLDINKIDARTLMAVVQDITDLTVARREVVRQTHSQRLLASVFMRIKTPVVVVRADGFILMANQAFQMLLGYDSKGIAGLNISALLPLDCAGAARAARAQQMLDGGCYALPMEIMSKAGSTLHVTMNSSLLRESDSKQIRVITLTACSEPGQPASAVRGANRVEVLSLDSLRQAIGSDWARVSDRGMSLAEQVVKRLLAPDDILKRGKGDSFVIWFSDSNQSQNAIVIARAMYGIRRVFMTEFGSKISARVEASSALDVQRELATHS